MRVTIQFDYRIHYPKRSRFTFVYETTFTENMREVKITVVKPIGYNTHSLQNNSEEGEVRDAIVPIVLTCDIEKERQDFTIVAKLVDRFSVAFFTALRGRAHAAQLRVRGVGDLEFNLIRSEATGRKLADWTKEFGDFLMDLDPGSPGLPLVTSAAWQSTLNIEQEGEAALEFWNRATPLHETLLLDAEVALYTDPRSAILFAAIACETFILNFLRERSQSNRAYEALLTWLDPPPNQKREPELEWKRPPVLAYFNQISRLVLGESLRDSNRKLWDDLDDLFGARNTIAHRGTLPAKLDPSHLVKAAREAINWASSK